jgi:DNA invertase Pin-like site-specific DNA recombinase
MKTLAYLRISTDSQDLNAQKLAILDFAQREGIVIDAFIEATASAGKTRKARRLDELMDRFDRGDRLIVSELSRLGRSLGQVIGIVDTLVKRKIAFIAVKENIRFEGKQDMQTKVMVALFALFAEVERDLISERTKEGLAKARASGKKLGRPKGALGRSRLNGKEGEIQTLLEKGVSKAAIAKINGVSRTTLYHFIQTRRLDAVSAA